MARAFAHTNIALVKYWGKRDDAPAALNLPATGSLSLTLDRFGTETAVELHDAAADALVLDGAVADAAKVSRFLDVVRARAGRTERARVTSTNHVPTAAGLASSASAFAALAKAATAAYGLVVDDRALSQLARMGSGSAARSVFGGFVVLHRGARDDGADCFAEPLASPIDARLVVVRCGAGAKSVSSTDGMGRTQRTSPYYAAWLATHAQDLDDARAALARGDLDALGEAMEHSTLKMHATTFAARPGFWYAAPTTFAVLDEVRRLRAAGTRAYFTMDAGPHVKVLCAPGDADAIARALGAVPGTHGVDVAGPGGPARLVP
jgi:diphosphomevalonate decarboxylase